MKRKPNLLWALAVLPLLLSANLASAYYDPGVQRWINRDPVSEPGFYRAAQPRYTLLHPTARDYEFVANDAVGKIDREGLWQVCCRSVRGGWGIILTHCDIRNGPCDPDPDSKGYPILYDCNCGDPGIKNASNMAKCLSQNPTDAGSGCWGDNCQSSSLNTLKKCCGKSPWQPSPYAYPLPTPPIVPPDHRMPYPPWAGL